ncbi:hypothetical protein BJ875DRAFT_504034 [Amylocarpus encephaloides]|uniref:MARVEL domain-containing protein n=1 Tax=Amylocarpus encephaloides TaxID=45428 RepID=A0A9P8C697_9HELO|nr:hypothetical protein BJ875DRAFT_504034 [Amylocarpus encephaloides]
MARLPHIPRKWKSPRAMMGLTLVELGGIIAALALFGIASPNLYRTKLWQIGADNGFNSNPKQILYAYANYRPIPKTPFVWSQALTDFNVAVSVLSMFIMIVKVILFALHVWYPLIAVITNLVTVGLWIASLYGQAGPDKSDPKHPSSSPWYITKSCSYAKPSNHDGYCLQAKASFAVTVIMLAVFLANLGLAIWSLIPTAGMRAADKVDVDDMQMKGGGGSGNASDEEMNVEMKTVNPNAVPYTPRTLAFNTLDRQLPLRSQKMDSSNKGKGARFA